MPHPFLRLRGLAGHEIILSKTRYLKKNERIICIFKYTYISCCFIGVSQLMSLRCDSALCYFWNPASISLLH